MSRSYIPEVLRFRANAPERPQRVLATRGGFVHVRLPSGREGWLVIYYGGPQGYSLDYTGVPLKLRWSILKKDKQRAVIEVVLSSSPGGIGPPKLSVTL